MTGRFSVNEERLRDWLTKRQRSLEQGRIYAESLWRQLRLYYEPALGKALLDGDPDQRAASREDDKIFNSTPRRMLYKMAAGLQSGITNQARAWFRLTLQNAKLLEVQGVSAWLGRATDEVMAAMASSNAYPALDEIYMHLGQFGVSCAIITHDEAFNAHVDVLDEGSYWLSENNLGQVDTVLRKVQLSLGQIVEKFGIDALPDDMRRMFTENAQLEKFYEIDHLICPRSDVPFDLSDDLADEMSYVSIYWLGSGMSTVQAQAKAGEILTIRGFDYKPIVAPRWMSNGSVYGTGPGAIGFADAKELQRLELDRAKIVAQEAEPTMLAPSYMKGEPLNRNPGGIVYYQGEISGKGGVPVQRLFATNQRLDAVTVTIQEVERAIRENFFVDLFAMLQNASMMNSRMTATEVNELASEKVALLGPTLTRMNWDLLGPWVDAFTEVAIKRSQWLTEHGVRDLALANLPPILQSVDTVLTPEFQSSLHVSQKATSLINDLNMIVQFGIPLAQITPQVLDAYDTDEMVRQVGAAVGAHGCIRDAQQIEQIRMQRAQAQQAAEQAAAQTEQLKAEASAIRDLGSTPTPDGGNMLEMLANMQQIQGRV